MRGTIHENACPFRPVLHVVRVGEGPFTTATGSTSSRRVKGATLLAAISLVALCACCLRFVGQGSGDHVLMSKTSQEEAMAFMKAANLGTSVTQIESMLTGASEVLSQTSHHHDPKLHSSDEGPEAWHSQDEDKALQQEEAVTHNEDALKIKELKSEIQDAETRLRTQKIQKLQSAIQSEEQTLKDLSPKNKNAPATVHDSNAAGARTSHPSPASSTTLQTTSAPPRSIESSLQSGSSATKLAGFRDKGFLTLEEQAAASQDKDLERALQYRQAGTRGERQVLRDVSTTKGIVRDLANEGGRLDGQHSVTKRAGQLMDPAHTEQAGVVLASGVKKEKHAGREVSIPTSLLKLEKQATASQEKDTDDALVLKKSLKAALQHEGSVKKASTSTSLLKLEKQAAASQEKDARKALELRKSSNAALQDEEASSTTPKSKPTGKSEATLYRQAIKEKEAEVQRGWKAEVRDQEAENLLSRARASNTATPQYAPAKSPSHATPSSASSSSSASLPSISATTGKPGSGRNNAMLAADKHALETAEMRVAHIKLELKSAEKKAQRHVVQPVRHLHKSIAKHGKPAEQHKKLQMLARDMPPRAVSNREDRTDLTTDAHDAKILASGKKAKSAHARPISWPQQLEAKTPDGGTKGVKWIMADVKNVMTRVMKGGKEAEPMKHKVLDADQSARVSSIKTSKPKPKRRQASHEHEDTTALERKVRMQAIKDQTPAQVEKNKATVAQVQARVVEAEGEVAHQLQAKAKALDGTQAISLKEQTIRLREKAIELEEKDIALKEEALKLQEPKHHSAPAKTDIGREAHHVQPWSKSHGAKHSIGDSATARHGKEEGKGEDNKIKAESLVSFPRGAGSKGRKVKKLSLIQQAIAEERSDRVKGLQEEAADVRALQRFRVAADAKPAHSHGAKAGKDGTHLSRRVEGTRADAQEADTHNVLKAAVRASSQTHKALVTARINAHSHLIEIEESHLDKGTRSLYNAISSGHRSLTQEGDSSFYQTLKPEGKSPATDQGPVTRSTLEEAEAEVNKDKELEEKK